MGVNGFWAWLSKTVGYKPIRVLLRKDDTFIVDAKLMMNKIAYGVDSDCENLALEVADRIALNFQRYKDVLFVNDGNTEIPGLKSPTLEKRAKAKNQLQAKVQEQEVTLKRKSEELDAESAKKVKTNQETENLEENNTETKMQEIKELEKKMENTKRQARRITTEMSMEILSHLQQKGFKTLQCKGEADPILVQLSSKYTYLVSEDGDLIIGGANNLLRSFGKDNLCYSNICKKVNFTQLQLKEMACMSGCDYTKGLERIGFPTAALMIRKYNNLETFLKSEEGSKHDPNFLKLANQAITLFTPNFIISEVCEVFPKDLAF